MFIIDRRETFERLQHLWSVEQKEVETDRHDPGTQQQACQKRCAGAAESDQVLFEKRGAVFDVLLGIVIRRINQVNDCSFCFAAKQLGLKLRKLFGRFIELHLIVVQRFVLRDFFVFRFAGRPVHLGVHSSGVFNTESEFFPSGSFTRLSGLVVGRGLRGCGKHLPWKRFFFRNLLGGTIDVSQKPIMFGLPICSGADCLLGLLEFGFDYLNRLGEVKLQACPDLLYTVINLGGVELLKCRPTFSGRQYQEQTNRHQYRQHNRSGSDHCAQCFPATTFFKDPAMKRTKNNNQQRRQK